jgi:hypothetical protein
MLKVALYQGGSLSTNCSVNMLIRPLGPSSASPDGLKEHFIHFPCQVKGSLSRKIPEKYEGSRVGVVSLNFSFTWFLTAEIVYASAVIFIVLRQKE